MDSLASTATGDNIIKSTMTLKQTEEQIELAEQIESEAPQQIDVTIVDAMFILHNLVNPPMSFRGIAQLIL
jgi:hypothetical protein